jgi:hypothetical protein
LELDWFATEGSALDFDFSGDELDWMDGELLCEDVSFLDEVVHGGWFGEIPLFGIDLHGGEFDQILNRAFVEGALDEGAVSEIGNVGSPGGFPDCLIEENVFEMSACECCDEDEVEDN